MIAIAYYSHQGNTPLQKENAIWANRGKGSSAPRGNTQRGPKSKVFPAGRPGTILSIKGRLQFLIK